MHIKSEHKLGSNSFEANNELLNIKSTPESDNAVIEGTDTKRKHTLDSGIGRSYIPTHNEPHYCQYFWFRKFCHFSFSLWHTFVIYWLEINNICEIFSFGYWVIRQIIDQICVKPSTLRSICPDFHSLFIITKLFDESE